MRNLLLILLSISVPALAQAQNIDASKLADGSYVYKIAVRDGRVVSVLPEQVFVLDGQPAPTPTPTPDPSLTLRGIKVRDAALKAVADTKRDETAMKLSVLYSEIAKKAGNEFKGQEALSFVSSAGTAAVFTRQGTGTDAAWKDFTAVYKAEWVKLAQEGGADADYAKLMNEVSAGLVASIQNRQALDLAQIIELIKLILELIQQLFPRGGR